MEGATKPITTNGNPIFEPRHVVLLVKAPQPEVQFEDNTVDFEI